MNALTDLDTQVTLAEKAVANLRMRAQSLSSTDTTGGTSTGGSVDSGSSTTGLGLGLGSGGPNPMNRDIIIDNINTELGISTSNGSKDGGVSPADLGLGSGGPNPMNRDIEIKYPVDPLSDDGPTTSNGTTLTDDAKDSPKASILIQKPNTKMRNLLIYLVVALGAYMVFRKK
jgi:hypothetical protein